MAMIKQLTLIIPSLLNESNNSRVKNQRARVLTCAYQLALIQAMRPAACARAAARWDRGLLLPLVREPQERSSRVAGHLPVALAVRRSAGALGCGSKRLQLLPC